MLALGSTLFVEAVSNDSCELMKPEPVTDRLAQGPPVDRPLMVLGVPIAGSLALFAGGVAVYLLSITSLSIMIATQVSSMPQFGLLALPVFIILNQLSGSTTPLESMPETLQRIMQFSPSTHFVSFAQAVLYRGASVNVVWKDCTVIAALGLLFFRIALLRFRRMVAQMQT
jgi:ABC-2 type transport system permease protein